MPNGIAFRDGDLYIADIGRIFRLRDIEEHLDNPPEPELLYDGLPSDRAHGWKYIDFGPDGMLYVPVGAPCNICNPDDPRYAAIHKMNPDGSDRTLVAAGVRNSVGFDWHPRTRELWFTDNGRDWLGDNRPPDELNRVSAEGAHFGYPYIHGTDVRDPEFYSAKPADLETTAPVQELGPHVAALGMHFYRGRHFPREYRGQIFIAEHGSWNRSTPIGYRVTLVRLDGNEARSYEVLASGWLEEDGDAWGRPVDIFELPDGSLLVSDDKAGALYRITYTEPSKRN
jgi:glucose/arabinose dehydrogenase